MSSVTLSLGNEKEEEAAVAAMEAAIKCGASSASVASGDKV